MADNIAPAPVIDVAELIKIRELVEDLGNPKIMRGAWR